MYVRLLLGDLGVEKAHHAEQHVDGVHIAVCDDRVGAVIGGYEQVVGEDGAQISFIIF